MKRLREFFESVAFAGLKPAGQKGAPQKPKGRLGSAIERFISGPAPSDPLYLTNRSIGQKIRFWSVIALPCLVLAAGIGVALTRILNPAEAKPAAEPTAKELSAKILPNIDTSLRLEQNNDIEVVELKVEHTSGSHLTGIVRNTTNHEIAAAHVVVDLTDATGSQVGGVEARVENIPASKTKAFSLALVQRTAAFALVREVGPVR